jgi:hypothetical protein
MSYGWIIDRDYTTIPDAQGRGGAGTTGQSDAPNELISILERGTAPTPEPIGDFGIDGFELRDGNGDGDAVLNRPPRHRQRRHRGRLLRAARRLGGPSARATDNRYPGKTNMDCG